MPGTTQLRTYTVKDALLDEWMKRRREEIVQLRLELGFTVGGAWTDRERNQIIPHCGSRTRCTGRRLSVKR